MTTKVIRGEFVAVIIHAEYGGGWYSWHRDESLLYDPVVVNLIECNDELNYNIYAQDKDMTYVAGFSNLSIQWIPIGAKFRIHEYDGWESIELFDDAIWLTA